MEVTNNIVGIALPPVGGVCATEVNRKVALFTFFTLS